jgi:hypothetical protein
MGRKTWHLAPFAEDGSLAAYVYMDSRAKAGDTFREFIASGDGGGRYQTVTLREPEPFQAPLRVVDFERGRSAARLIWANEADATFPMFMVDIVDTLRRVELQDGWTEAEVTWEVVKRGANFGIRMVGDPA